MIEFDKIEKIAEYKDGELNWLEGRDINAVYLILVGDEYYIGSSHYVYLRIQQHLKSLLYENHHSDKLQNKFNEIKALDVYVLERGIEKKYLLSREEYYIKKFNPTLNIKQPVKDTGHLKIKEFMIERQISSAWLAEKVGISKVAISNIITGKSLPSLENLIRIAETMDVSVSQLIGEEDQALHNAITCPHCGKKILLDVEKDSEG